MDRLQAMQIFVRVVELGNFSRAADALDLSRARASEAVQGLERALGTRLLHRTTRRLSLTDDGRAYFERVRRILLDVAEAEAEVVRARSAPRGRLRVDMPVALARLFLVPALPRLLRRHPELELEIRLENRAVELIREGIDCAITYGEPSDTDLVARRLASTHLVTCAAPSYLSRRGVPTTPNALSRHNCVAFLGIATSRPVPWEFSEAGTRLTERPVGNLAFNSMEACVDAACAGLGVTQVLSSVAHRAIASGALTPILLNYACAGPQLFFVYPPNRQASARLKSFLAFVSEVFAEVDADFDMVERAGRARGRRPQVPAP